MAPKVTELSVPYIWAHCPLPCRHSAALPLHAVVGRFGPALSTDHLRRRLRCTVCGHKGATLIVPTPPGRDQQWEPIPYARAPDWAKPPPTWGRVTSDGMEGCA